MSRAPEKQHSFGQFILSVFAMLGVLFIFGAHELIRDHKADQTVKKFVKFLEQDELSRAYHSMDKGYKEKVSFEQFLDLPLVRNIEAGWPILCQKALAPGRYRYKETKCLSGKHLGSIGYSYQGNLLMATLLGRFKVSLIK